MDASHLLSPVRPPTELAEERSAISTDLSDAISSLPKPELNGSSLQPLCSPTAVEAHPQEFNQSDEALFLDQILKDLKYLLLEYLHLFTCKDRGRYNLEGARSTNEYKTSMISVLLLFSQIIGCWKLFSSLTKRNAFFILSRNNVFVIVTVVLFCNPTQYCSSFTAKIKPDRRQSG